MLQIAEMLRQLSAPVITGDTAEAKYEQTSFWSENVPAGLIVRSRPSSVRVLYELGVIKYVRTLHTAK